MNAHEHYRLVAGMALADGLLDPRERLVLDRCASLLGLDPDTTRELEASISSGGAVRNVELPEDDAERRELFTDLVAVLVADRRVASEEEQYLLEIAPAFGVSPRDVRARLNNALRLTRLLGGLDLDTPEPTTDPAPERPPVYPELSLKEVQRAFDRALLMAGEDVTLALDGGARTKRGRVIFDFHRARFKAPLRPHINKGDSLTLPGGVRHVVRDVRIFEVDNTPCYLELSTDLARDTGRIIRQVLS